MQIFTQRYGKILFWINCKYEGYFFNLRSVTNNTPLPCKHGACSFASSNISATIFILGRPLHFVLLTLTFFYIATTYQCSCQKGDLLYYFSKLKTTALQQFIAKCIQCPSLVMDIGLIFSKLWISLMKFCSIHYIIHSAMSICRAVAFSRRNRL